MCFARVSARRSILLLAMSPLTAPRVNAQQAPPNTPTLQVTSRLVFLDVTVLDKKGRPVVTGLAKDDFSITDNKKPQRIFSFQPPDTHTPDRNATEDLPAGNAPVTIFVVDRLDSSFTDFAYIRYMVRKYLTAQPAQLNAPAELMVLDNDSLEMVQGYTRNKADLLYALNHIQTALPYKEMNGSFAPERFGQAIDALQQIALQNKGISGHKNIIWVGHGAPSLQTFGLPGSTIDELNRYVHDTTNQLVDARMSLFVIYPGLPVRGPSVTLSELSAISNFGDDDDPFSGDINFGVFVNETGGKLFYNRNDVNTEINEAQQLGSEFYTLTYQPTAGNMDGKFRRIHVTLRDPNLHAMAKTGYFEPDKTPAADPRQQRLADISEALYSTLPLDTLGVTIANLVRHPDTHTVQFTVLLAPRNIAREPTNDGGSSFDLTLAAASLSGYRDFLATKVLALKVASNSHDSAQLGALVTRIPVTIRIPRKTQTVRVVIQLGANGRTGAAELTRKAIDNAPQAPTPTPQLLPLSQKPQAPPTQP
jgi:VWFA-related protein